MKTRNGFVSNSSASSFVVNKMHVTTEQIEKIYNHHTSDYFKDTKCHLFDKWTVTEDEHTIHGLTDMDNFDMSSYLHIIGINSENVQFDNF